jgi:hypothetical protein
MERFSFISKGNEEYIYVQFGIGYIEGYMLYRDGDLVEVMYWSLN